MCIITIRKKIFWSNKINVFWIMLSGLQLGKRNGWRGKKKSGVRTHLIDKQRNRFFLKCQRLRVRFIIALPFFQKKSILIAGSNDFITLAMNGGHRRYSIELTT